MGFDGDSDDVDLKLQCNADSFSFETQKVIFFLAFLTQTISEASSGYYLVAVYYRIFALVAKQIL